MRRITRMTCDLTVAKRTDCSFSFKRTNELQRIVSRSRIWWWITRGIIHGVLLCFHFWFRDKRLAFTTKRALFRINRENCQPSLYVKERLRVPRVPSRSFFEQSGVEFSLTPKFDRLPSRFANFLVHEIKRPRNEFSDENPDKMGFISS